MARHANPAPQGATLTDADTPGLPAMVDAANERVKQLMVIDERYGHGQPYERERVISEFSIHIGNASNSLIEAGKCVILIREHEPRGDFDRLVEERLGMSRRSAYKFMSATRRLVELSPETVQPVARIGQSKLLDLMVEADNEDLEELARGGTFAGLELSDMEGMTRRELQAALKEARAVSEAKDKLLADKNAKIDTLATELEKGSAKPKSALAQADYPEQILGLSDDLHALGKVMDEVMSKHLTLVDATELVYGAMPEGDPAHDQYKAVVFRMGEQIERLCTLAAGLRNHYEVTLAGYVAMDKTYILPED